MKGRDTTGELYVFVGEGNAGVTDEGQLHGSAVVVVDTIALPCSDK